MIFKDYLFVLFGKGSQLKKPCKRPGPTYDRLDLVGNLEIIEFAKLSELMLFKESPSKNSVLSLVNCNKLPNPF
jgi:hypothetical protein